MTELTGEAAEARLVATLPRRDRRKSASPVGRAAGGVRGAVGHWLIGLGRAIAGDGVETGVRRAV